jgi:hypothetical protein
MTTRSVGASASLVGVDTALNQLALVDRDADTDGKRCSPIRTGRTS